MFQGSNLNSKEVEDHKFASIGWLLSKLCSNQFWAMLLVLSVPASCWCSNIRCHSVYVMLLVRQHKVPLSVLASCWYGNYEVPLSVPATKHPLRAPEWFFCSMKNNSNVILFVRNSIFKFVLLIFCEIVITNFVVVSTIDRQTSFFQYPNVKSNRSNSKMCFGILVNCHLDIALRQIKQTE